MNSDDVLKWIYETNKTPKFNLDGKLFVLAYLNKVKNVKSADLSTSLGASRARITCILKDLENDNLIKREKSIDDKRITFVSLTKNGEEFVNNKFLEIKTCIDSVLNEVGETKFKTYMEVVETINKNVRRIKNETNN